jgi:hypothetical protein
MCTRFFLILFFFLFSAHCNAEGLLPSLYGLADYPAKHARWDNLRIERQISTTFSLTLSDPGTAQSPCSNFQALLWWKAAHIGGNRNGRLNEDTRGPGLRCDLGTQEWLYAEYGKLENSNRGTATLTGFGIHSPRLKLGDFSTRINLSRYYVTYELPQYNAVVAGYATAPAIELGYNLKRNITLSWNILPVPKKSAPGSGNPKQILLYYMGIEYKLGRSYVL